MSHQLRVPAVYRCEPFGWTCTAVGMTGWGDTQDDAFADWLGLWRQASQATLEGSIV